jgi:Icc-related predicted phosphoesterase
VRRVIWSIFEDILLARAPFHPVRIAAVGDLHIRTEIPDGLQEALIALNGQVDLLVIAGDITDGGRIPEVELAAEMLSAVQVPMIGVLGNHDRRGLRRTMMRRTLEAAGLQVLDGDAVVPVLPDGRRIGIAGVSGTGGGFRLDESEAVIGGRLRQAVAIKARREAIRLKSALESLREARPDVSIVVTHFAPTLTTLGEEPVLKHWMLGNSFLGRIIDEESVDLVVHGHAHLGNRVGITAGGTPVRNVALQVTGGIEILDVGPGQQVRAIECISAPLFLRPVGGSRIRMMDMLRDD